MNVEYDGETLILDDDKSLLNLEYDRLCKLMLTDTHIGLVVMSRDYIIEIIRNTRPGLILKWLIVSLFIFLSFKLTLYYTFLLIPFGILMLF